LEVPRATSAQWPKTAPGLGIARIAPSAAVATATSAKARILQLDLDKSITVCKMGSEGFPPNLLDLENQYTSIKYNVYEVYAHDVRAYWVHTREMHAHEVHACKMHVYKVHTNEMHA
jgi:hypothetical protein